MNTTTTSISSTLLAAPSQLNIWFGSFLCITGNLGCIGNMIVFRSRSFRNRAYSIYLSSEAMSSFLYFNFILLTRVLQEGFEIPITTRYDTMCKIRQFISIWGNQVSFTFFAVATIDRLLSAQRSITYRKWSNRISLAYKLFLACSLFWLLLLGHRLILYSTINGSCVPLAGFYAYYDNYFEVVFASFCPPVVMFILAYLLMRSVRDVIQRRITPGDNMPNTAVIHRTVLQQMDSKLTLMLILQSIITVITYVPYASQLIYENVSANWPKSSLQNAEEKVLAEVTHLCSYIFFASSFYISFISNNGFRRSIKTLFCPRRHIDPAVHSIFRTHEPATVQPK